MAESFDVVVLGTRNAGMGVAGVTHAAGKSVAIVESGMSAAHAPYADASPRKFWSRQRRPWPRSTERASTKFPSVMSPWTGVH